MKKEIHRLYGFEMKIMIKYAKTWHQKRVSGAAPAMGNQYLQASAGNPWGGSAQYINRYINIHVYYRYIYIYGKYIFKRSEQDRIYIYTYI